MHWQVMKETDLWIEWKPLGPITGVFEETGLLNTFPMQKFTDDFKAEHGDKIRRKVVVGSVDAVTGMYTTFNETSHNMTEKIRASSAMPFLFPAIDIGSFVGMDGGSVWNINLASAVERCREIVDDDSKITIDIVMCSSHELAEFEPSHNAYTNFARFKDIHKFYGSVDDVYMSMQAFPEVNFRHYIWPSHPLPSGRKEIDVDNSTNTYAMQMLGRQDGAAAVANEEEGLVFSKIRDYYESKDIRSEFADIGKYLEEEVVVPRQAT
mmetsp:Transcript_41906/g.64132  ORF Transcript_41906/g.64132 Transcript_41906/m.64132 type:complete len:266 (-) Transcript_41906:29-826(-)